MHASSVNSMLGRSGFSVFNWRRLGVNMRTQLKLSVATLLVIALQAGPTALIRCGCAQDEAAIDLQTYRAELTGLPDFDCVSVEGVGIDIVFPTGDKNRKPKGSKPEEYFSPRVGATSGPSPGSSLPDQLKRKSRIHLLRLERRFTKDRQFHAWIQNAREGDVEPRDGALLLQDSAGRTIVRFNFLKARPIRWVVNIPRKDEPKKPVTETVVLCVQSMEMVY